MTDLHSLHEKSLQHPDLVASVFSHPDDVLYDTRLTAQLKRELLASWASDANAVPHLPTLRQLPNGSIVKLHDIFEALKALDAGADVMDIPGRCIPLWQRSLERRRGVALRRWFRYGRSPTMTTIRRHVQPLPQLAQKAVEARRTLIRNPWRRNVPLRLRGERVVCFVVSPHSGFAANDPKH